MSLTSDLMVGLVPGAGGLPALVLGALDVVAQLATRAVVLVALRCAVRQLAADVRQLFTEAVRFVVHWVVGIYNITV